MFGNVAENIVEYLLGDLLTLINGLSFAAVIGIALKKEKLPLVAYLVNEELADARAIAVAASHEFGVPLLDLDAIDIDIDVIRAVDQKLINKHRVLPLVQRGQRLFLGISDPTNLAAIDDIKFQTSLRIDPVVVEQDKLEERIVKAIEESPAPIHVVVKSFAASMAAIISSAAVAAISAPRPDRCGFSSTVISRPVLATESFTVSQSNGTSERGSITSTPGPTTRSMAGRRKG